MSKDRVRRLFEKYSNLVRKSRSPYDVLPADLEALQTIYRTRATNRKHEDIILWAHENRIVLNADLDNLTPTDVECLCRCGCEWSEEDDNIILRV